jgi:hypothetical protein
VDDTPNDQIEETQDVKSPDRRKILKLLAAGSAVTAVTMLPGKWSSPVVKSGVLPAHAQVTPTATPVPEYEVRCAQWGWRIIEDEVSYYEFFGSATAVDITNNVALANVRLNGTALIAPATFRSSFGDTDANGVANIVIAADIQDVQLTSIEITVSFDDVGQYGNDTCTTTVELQQPN